MGLGTFGKRKGFGRGGGIGDSVQTLRPAAPRPLEPFRIPPDLKRARITGDAPPMAKSPAEPLSPPESNVSLFEGTAELEKPLRDAMSALEAREQGDVNEAALKEDSGPDLGIHRIKEQVLPRLLERIDAEAAVQLTRDELNEEFGPIIFEVLSELRITLNRREQFALEKVLIDELLGLGPLEPLLGDPEIADIMVNGPDQVYVERKGRLILTNVRFRDEEHVNQIAQRICNRVGRRIDQTSPLADARLEDGSRVNVIVPPLSLKGTAISIRKFATKPITLDAMAKNGNCSEDMATFLKIAAASRLNIVISGGTGSGKTTLLNALSKLIAPGERIITIEDAAELQLQQPHVLTLETRPANLEGRGAITIRDLMINALRMRPDRIILGEVRGAECFDMLQAMNTGHEGSMCTLHANSPREALSRMENMVMMSNLSLPKEAITRQIAGSIDLIVQVRRMRDGHRRITSITEVVGMEGQVVTTQDLFNFRYEDEDSEGRIVGSFEKSGHRPATLQKAKEFGFEQAYLEASV